MPHITQATRLGGASSKFAFAFVNVTSYVQGGEQFTIAEFGLVGPLVDLFLIQTLGDNPANTAQFIDTSNVKLNGIIKINSVLTRGDAEQATGPCDIKFLVVVQGS